jgi:hypothetical protein
MILDDTVGFGIFAILKSVPRTANGCTSWLSRWLDGFVVISTETWHRLVPPLVQM